MRERLKVNLRVIPELEGPVMKFRAPSRTRVGRQYDHITLLHPDGHVECCCEAGKMGNECWAMTDVKEGRFVGEL